MAIATTELILGLREAANRLRNGAVYAWGNHGACNCGQLVQVIGGLTREEIISYTKTGSGEWTELAEDYCGITDAPVSLLVGKLQQIGLTPSDIHHLEYLNDRTILNHLPGGFRWLRRNNREDVVLYFEAFASLLEDQLLSGIQVQHLVEGDIRETQEIYG